MVVALFPGALGDLLCCWPALNAWRRAEAAALKLVAHAEWAAVLPEDVTLVSVDRREIADLFATGFLGDGTRSLFAGAARIESWTGYGDPNFASRLAAASGTAVAVHPFRALRPGEHAAEYYSRCLGVAHDFSPLPVGAAAAAWAEELWRTHHLGSSVLCIHAGSGSGRKNWTGMAAAAAEWRKSGGQVVAIAGPAELGHAAAFPADVALDCEPLDRVAAVLSRAYRYLGNDSGISHLAAGIGARGIALFGPTDPRGWRPLGTGIRVLSNPRPCPSCGPARFCTHRIAVANVLGALRKR